MVQLPWNLFSSEDPIFDIEAVPDESTQLQKMRTLWDANAKHNPLVCNDFFCGGFQEQYERNGQRLADFLARKLQLAPGAKILDLGGGSGRIARYLAQGCESYTLADISPNLVCLAQARLPEKIFQFTCLSENRLPYPDQSFSDCIAIDTVMHLPERTLRAYFNEVARVLTPGGKFFLTVGVSLEGPTDIQAGRSLMRLLNLKPVPVGSRVGAVMNALSTGSTLTLKHRGNDFPNQLPMIGVQAPFSGNYLLFERT
ncbi:MAG: class I SAM-dependent methyltransferase [Anaerolineae bacterium]|nr:class I SAM-dependent methyltransferase [Gloeobacterales cyanobacterium ES-bin-313]